MEVYKLEDMVKGWFIGNFQPTLLNTNDVEVGVKKYKAGDAEGYHHHKIATEFTVILNGEVEMSGKTYNDGDIIVIKPGVSTNFTAITDVTTVVVKLPGANNDKYIDK
ncbi:cupin domain-containing protein [Parasediminibacterium sp. JCM 36343]|uniref:cupin domain-containing protein n=1 Tax=Parasediminibacterium sp. JCM 36343 TaxID=3374279 RepID=UPI00397918C3